MNPIGAGFGVVGNLIEARRAAGAQQEMQAVLAKASYNYEAALSDSVFVAMSKAGFAMVHSPESRPENERSRVHGRAIRRVKRVDAFLDVYADYVGFQAMQSSEDYRPHLEISARLVDAKSGKILYQGGSCTGFPWRRRRTPCWCMPRTLSDFGIVRRCGPIRLTGASATGRDRRCRVGVGETVYVGGGTCETLKRGNPESGRPPGEKADPAAGHELTSGRGTGRVAAL